MKIHRGLSLVAVVFLLFLGALTLFSYYFNPCGHDPVASVDHYREILANLSVTNVSKVYIRHDIDACMDRLWPLLEVEKELNFTSTICLYPVINRGGWFRSKQKVEWERLHWFADHGWIVSYHLNAYERARYDPVRGDRLAMKDVAWLYDHGFDVDRFSPHGGYWGGRNGSVNNYRFSGRFANLSGLSLDMHWGYDFYFSDSNGVIFSIPKDISGSVYILVHPEWYGGNGEETVCDGC